MPHGLLSRQVIIKEPGYAYIYLSNEGAVQQDIYFDDLTMTHKKSPIVQGQEYYPFGLTFNSYQKESTLRNDWKFQGQEHVDGLDLNWDQFKWRNHQPDIGRFFNVDPLSDRYVHNSPYAFSENKVTAHVELEGLEAHPAMYLLKKEVQKVEKAVNSVLNTAQQTISNGIETIANAIGSVGNSEHGFILTSENGGVRGGSSEGVRKGLGEELEVGHLLNPSTRKESMDLVKDVENEFGLIEGSVVDDVSNGSGSVVQQPASSGSPATDMGAPEPRLVPGNPSPAGTRSAGEKMINDSTKIIKHWESEGPKDGQTMYRRVRVDTVNIKNEDERR
jgi:RHS repeat-associated protein